MRGRGRGGIPTNQPTDSDQLSSDSYLSDSLHIPQLDSTLVDTQHNQHRGRNHCVGINVIYFPPSLSYNTSRLVGKGTYDHFLYGPGSLEQIDLAVDTGAHRFLT